MENQYDSKDLSELEALIAKLWIENGYCNNNEDKEILDARHDFYAILKNVHTLATNRTPREEINNYVENSTLEKSLKILQNGLTHTLKDMTYKEIIQALYKCLCQLDFNFKPFTENFSRTNNHFKYHVPNPYIENTNKAHHILTNKLLKAELQIIKQQTEAPMKEEMQLAINKLKDFKTMVANDKHISDQSNISDKLTKLYDFYDFILTQFNSRESYRNIGAYCAKKMHEMVEKNFETVIKFVNEYKQDEDEREKTLMIFYNLDEAFDPLIKTASKAYEYEYENKSNSLHR